MSNTRPGAMNIEARALADAILADDRYVYQVSLEYDRETASEAIHGGRALTEKIAMRQGVLQTLVDDPDREPVTQERVKEVWQYQIDPAYSSWANVAGVRMAEAGRKYAMPVMPLRYAESMLDWPIYRAAIAQQEREPAFVEGYMRAQNDRDAREALEREATR